MQMWLIMIGWMVLVQINLWDGDVCVCVCVYLCILYTEPNIVVREHSIFNWFSRFSTQILIFENGWLIYHAEVFGIFWKSTKITSKHMLYVCVFHVHNSIETHSHTHAQHTYVKVHVCRKAKLLWISKISIKHKRVCWQTHVFAFQF